MSSTFQKITNKIISPISPIAYPEQTPNVPLLKYIKTPDDTSTMEIKGHGIITEIKNRLCLCGFIILDRKSSPAVTYHTQKPIDDLVAIIENKKTPETKAKKKTKKMQRKMSHLMCF